LYVISSALGALVLMATTTLSTSDIQQLEASYESMNVKVSEADYLDKIIQLPFVISPVSPDSLGGFIENLLPEELRSAVPDLIEGLGNNPRQVKRFINSFLLNDELAREVTEAYDARWRTSGRPVPGSSSRTSCSPRRRRSGTSPSRWR
jgi:hypothetical protein